MTEQEKANAVTAAAAGGLVAPGAIIVHILATALSPPPLAIFLFAFPFIMFPAFLFCFSGTALGFVGLARITQSQWIRWLYFPLTGAAVGFVLTLVLGALIGPAPITTVAGFLGGIGSAVAWGRYRVAEAAPQASA